MMLTTSSLVHSMNSLIVVNAYFEFYKFVCIDMQPDTGSAVETLQVSVGTKELSAQHFVGRQLLQCIKVNVKHVKIELNS